MTRGFTKRSMGKRGLLKLIALTLGGVTLCVTVSVLFAFVLFRSADSQNFLLAMIAAVTLPIILAGPLFAFISIKLRQLSQLNRELRYTATHDHLTGLLNRGAFTQAVVAVLDDVSRRDDGQGALFLVDADFFKYVNDRWGHPMGDRALAEIAARLRDTVPGDGMVGRLGGEEFGVFLPDSGWVQAMATSERLRTAVQEIELVGPAGELIRLSISVGGTWFRYGLAFEQIFQRADRMLYQAKADGRNRIRMENDAPREALVNAG